MAAVNAMRIGSYAATRVTPPSLVSGEPEKAPMMHSSTSGKPVPHSSGTTSRTSSLASVRTRAVVAVMTVLLFLR